MCVESSHSGSNMGRLVARTESEMFYEILVIICSIGQAHSILHDVGLVTVSVYHLHHFQLHAISRMKSDMPHLPTVFAVAIAAFVSPE